MDSLGGMGGNGGTMGGFAGGTGGRFWQLGSRNSAAPICGAAWKNGGRSGLEAGCRGHMTAEMQKCKS